MIGSQYHWRRIVQKLERPGHWRDYLNLYFWLPRSKTGEALKIKKIARRYIYWEVRENDLVFIHDNTMRESRDTVHWQVLKLVFLVGGKQECVGRWQWRPRTTNVLIPSPVLPEMWEGCRKNSPQWRANDPLE